MNRFWSILFLLVPVLGFGVCLFSALGLSPMENTWLPTDISKSGVDIDRAFLVVMWIIGVVFVATGLVLAYSLWSHGYSKERKADYSHGNTKLEILWSVIPGVILIGIFVYQSIYWEKQKIDQPTVVRSDGTNQLQEPIVRVVARKFGWRFWYAGPDQVMNTHDDFVLENELYLPMDEPLVLQMESEDVLHSFYLRNLRIKQDLIPGKKQFAWFEIVSSKVKEGQVYDVLCAELCGWGHSRMNGRVYPLSREAFDKFQQEQHQLQNSVTVATGEAK